MPDKKMVSDDRIIVLHPLDNVVTLKVELPQGSLINGPCGEVVCRQTIPRGHKLAVKDIGEGEKIIKYNQVIGFASCPIPAGAHVHSHNVALRDFERDFAFCQARCKAEIIAPEDVPVFQGYRRADGGAGTRNFIVILSTVNCSATVSRGIADAFRGPALKDYRNIDGVVACTHDFGCMAHTRLEKVIAGYARHPNVAGFMLVGLGCESNNVGALARNYNLPDNDMARYLVIQEEGGTRKAVDKGIAMVRDMLRLAGQCRREPIPVSELVVGLQCGGSDAYSGVTANPALGGAVDLLVGLGGTAILSETPEIFGAEHLLTRRAASPGIAHQLVELIAWWQDYAAINGAELDNNPSTGNKRGGLTTILEKSLGAVAKGGTTSLNGVYGYADRVTAKGLTFMDSPGYDPTSITGMIAGGATIICFTTGRGSVFGAKPVPSLKLATNTTLFEHMSDDMDINTGLIMDGKETLATISKEILAAIVDTASGTPTKSELHGYGDEEFTPWQVGVVL